MTHQRYGVNESIQEIFCFNELETLVPKSPTGRRAAKDGGDTTELGAASAPRVGTRG